MVKNNNSNINKVVVILGPTSSGKSDVAIRLAKKFDGEIISADSRQIYRGMDIGTGKIEGNTNPPSPFRRGCPNVIVGAGEGAFYSASIPHYLIDIVNPTQNYNAADFKKDAEILIKDILSRGKLPIICGGTGFWIKAVVDNIIFPEVKPDKKLRKILEKYSADKLFKMLGKLDPERAKNIDAKNKVRLIRAIEICKALGKVPAFQCHCERSEAIPKLETQNSRLPRSLCSLAMTNGYNFLQIGINVPKEKLHSNIKKRLQKRFEQGMIKEVKKLRKSGLSWKKIQSFGLGYYWIPLFLQNKLSKEELFEKIYQAEKDYAKRQMTWFKKDSRIKWLGDYEKIEKETKKFFS